MEEFVDLRKRPRTKKKRKDKRDRKRVEAPGAKTEKKEPYAHLTPEQREKRRAYNREYSRKRGTKRTPESEAKTFHWRLRHRYGIGEDDYKRMVVAQNGVCAICHRPNSDGSRLHVDHRHDTGKVRGLLCRTCNMGIGSFKDDPALMHAAGEYVEKRS